MTPQQLDAARRNLLERRDRILARTTLRKRQVSEQLDSREIEVEENSAELQDVVRAAEIDAVEQRMIHALGDALDRIDAGTYGTCVVCGSPIETERLTALPEAQTCIEDAVANRPSPSHPQP